LFHTASQTNSKSFWVGRPFKVSSLHFYSILRGQRLPQNTFLDFV